MKYGIISKMVRLILIVVTGLILAFLIYPIVRYYTMPGYALDISIKSQSANGFTWIKNHYKVGERKEFTQEQTPDIVFIDHGESFSKDDLMDVDHNKLFLVALYHQFEDQPYNQIKLNESTGISWSGYVGKTIQDLGDLEEVPAKWVEAYEAFTEKKWSYQGEGIVIRNNKNIFVLRKGADYKKGLTLNYQGEKIPFYGVFEILAEDQRSEIAFHLDLNEASSKRFESHGLKNTFPAVVKLKWNLYEGYYFAGDFFSYAPDIFFQYSAALPLMQKKWIYDRFLGEESFWHFTLPFTKKVLEEPYERRVTINKSSQFSTEGNTFYQLKKNGKKEVFFSKGINLGAALPGKSFTEFPRDEDLYFDWIKQIKDLGYNTVRIYTLFPPEFYKALYEYNVSNDAPLLLLQEIWPEEHPLEGDYLAEAYNETYKKEIEMNIRALHGDLYIPPRSFRAHGAYLYDVSPYLLGYLVGRELEPEEVEATDRLNIGYVYEGDFVYSEKEASPTESWLAESCDYALQVEALRYENAPLVGIVNWPTLDPLEHDSEWNDQGDKSLQYNDKRVVDINHIGINPKKVAGFFGAYHIYPNYPDFMNNDPEYDSYEDSKGRFRYGGYLEAFMKNHQKYPALVAEYGMSTSAVTAHFSPDGLNHGGVSETDQISMNKRMTDAIIREGYSGAIIFEWMDEWTKKTWTTENYMIPYERNNLWHNVLDPEQNYGIMAVEAKPIILNAIYDAPSGYQMIEKIEAGQNASYLTLKIHFREEAPDFKGLKIGVNLHDESQEWTDEFVISFENEAKLLVNPGYNWLKGRYKSSSVPENAYEEMIQLVNKSNLTKDGVFTEEKSVNLSLLKMGDFKIPQNLIFMDKKEMTLRIPYGLIGVSDPSSKQILWDDKIFTPSGTNQIKTTSIDAVQFRLSYRAERSVTFDFTLKGWEIPEYQMRLKSSE